MADHRHDGVVIAPHEKNMPYPIVVQSRMRGRKYANWRAISFASVNAGAGGGGRRKRGSQFDDPWSDE